MKMIALCHTSAPPKPADVLINLVNRKENGSPGRMVFTAFSSTFCAVFNAHTTIQTGSRIHYAAPKLKGRENTVTAASRMEVGIWVKASLPTMEPAMTAKYAESGARPPDPRILWQCGQRVSVVASRRLQRG